MKISTQLFEKAFSGPRDPRSDAYKDGVRLALAYRLGEISMIPAFYGAGTAESDAFYAGTEEGHRIATEYQGEGA